MKPRQLVFWMCLVVLASCRVARGESRPVGEPLAPASKDAKAQAIDGIKLAGMCDRDPAIALSTKTACIAACNRGREAMESFCRGIADPRLKPGCWAAAVASTVACLNWCAWNY